jgi:aspartate/methionine/tyrosine aminotransferase
MPQARDLMAGILDKAGPRPITPAGAHYVMTDSTALGLGDGTTAATALVRRARVAAVPGSSFYSWPELGRSTH